MNVFEMKEVRMPFIVAMLALFVAFNANAQTPIPKEVQQITSQFHQTMMVCPQKIWAGYSWSGLKVVLMYPSRDKSWVWDASANSIETIANASLPSSAIGSTYVFFDIGGRNALSLNMEEKDTDYFEFGVHEFFHSHGQKDWTSENIGGGRGTEHPAKAQPRFYRRMIFDNLKKYFELGQSADLGRAKYWYDKWATEYPKEVAATTEGYEGTAEYVETLAKVLVEKGCAAPDAQLKAATLAKIKSDEFFGFSVSGEEFGLDSEGYELGGLAALALRFSSRDLQEWTAKMSKGSTPLQVLFDGVSSEAEEPPKALVAKFELAAKKINSERSVLLDQSIANWANKDFIRIAVPYEWLQSNLMPKFFAQSSVLSMDLYPLSVEHDYVAPSGGSSFKAKANTVVFDFQSAVCADQFSYALVSSAQINLIGKVATVTSPTLSGRLVGELKTDDQGFKYICVE